MNLRAVVVLFLLLAAVFLLAVVTSVDDTKHDVGNQVEDSKLSCKNGRCEHAREIPSVKAGETKYELDQGGGDTERGGGGGDSERRGGGGDRSRRGRRGRRGGRGGRGGGI